jgi:hypothetical protein
MKIKITFLIAFFSAIHSFAQWTPVGGLWFSDDQRTFPRIVNYHNKPLISFGSATDSLVDAYIYENGSWQQFGQPDFVKGHNYYSRMTTYNDSVYFSYRDIIGVPRVSVYRNGNWDSLGTPGGYGNGIFSLVYKDTLFVSFTDLNLANRMNYAKNNGVNDWNYSIASAITNSGCGVNSYMTVWGDSLFVMLVEGSNVKLHKYFNGNWVQHSIISSGIILTPQMSLKVNPLDNSLYAFVQFNSALANSFYVKKYVNGTWVNVGAPSSILPGGSTPFNVELDFINGAPIIIYQDNNTVKCKRFDGASNWINHGSPSLVPDGIDNTSMVVIGDTVFAIMRRTSDKKITVVKWDVLNNPPSIDFQDSAKFCNNTVGNELPFVLSDETPSTVILSAVSANTSLISNTSISFTGTGSNRSLMFDFNPGVYGSSMIVVQAMDDIGNTGKDTVYIHATTPDIQELCSVSVDSLTGNHNVVYWDKTMALVTDTFVIKREVTTNVYQTIGKVPYDSLSEYHDFGANPNTTGFRYKLATIDTCGTESALGLYHNTIWLNYLGNGILSWTAYSIEGTPNPVNGYNILRDNTGSGPFVSIGSTTGNQFGYTDVDYALYPNARYRVEVNWSISCEPTRGAINTTRSNIKTPTSIGINDLEQLVGLKLYPNPFSNYLVIESETSLDKATIEILNNLGQVVCSQELSGRQIKLDMTDLSSGVYYYSVKSAKFIKQGKITKA